MNLYGKWACVEHQRLIAMIYLTRNYNLFTGMRNETLWQQAKDTYSSALAPGTRLNKVSQAKIYLAFMLAHDIDPFRPSLPEVIMYVQLLKNSGKTPRTIKNYLSGAKTFLQERGYQCVVFNDYVVNNFMKDVERDSDFIPTQAPPIPVNVIRQLCVALRARSLEGVVVAAGVLFAYATMLRQSHLFYSLTTYQHMITRSDVHENNGVLYVKVRSSKTTSRSSLTILPVYSLTDPIVCPVTALRDVIRLTPALSRATLFLDPATGAAVTASRAMTLFRLGLRQVGFPGADSASFHSLRRTGVQICARAGVAVDDVKAHGLWKSDAIRAYMPRKVQQTSCALAKDLLNTH